jgi:hypothetical protein
MSDGIAVVRRLFAAVEDRDFDGLVACYSDDIEINEADVLPYAGSGAAGRASPAMPQDSCRHGVICRGPTSRGLTRNSSVTARERYVRCSGTVPLTR